MYMFMYTRVYKHEYLHMNMYIYAYMYTFIHTYIYIYTYIYISPIHELSPHQMQRAQKYVSKMAHTFLPYKLLIHKLPLSSTNSPSTNRSTNFPFDQMLWVRNYVAKMAHTFLPHKFPIHKPPLSSANVPPTDPTPPLVGCCVSKMAHFLLLFFLTNSPPYRIMCVQVFAYFSFIFLANFPSTNFPSTDPPSDLMLWTRDYVSKIAHMYMSASRCSRLPHQLPIHELSPLKRCCGCGIVYTK